MVNVFGFILGQLVFFTPPPDPFPGKRLRTRHIISSAGRDLVIGEKVETQTFLQLGGILNCLRIRRPFSHALLEDRLLRWSLLQAIQQDLD